MAASNEPSFADKVKAYYDKFADDETEIGDPPQQTEKGASTVEQGVEDLKLKDQDLVEAIRQDFYYIGGPSPSSYRQPQNPNDEKPEQDASSSS